MNSQVVDRDPTVGPPSVVAPAQSPSSDDSPNPLWLIAAAMAFAFAVAAAFLATPAPAATAADAWPATQTLLNAARDDVNWILPAKSYAGNRFTALTQIDKSNVAHLHAGWSTAIADDGEQEASPIIWGGTM